MTDVDEEERKVFACLFHGYYNMLCSEQEIDLLSKPLVQFIAVGYAILNTSLWEVGRQKLKGGDNDVEIL